MRTAITLGILAAWVAPAQVLPPPAPAVRRPPARPAAAPPSSYKDLKFPPMAPIAIPKVETATLPNGLRIYLLEDHELPMIHGTALVRTGRVFDPAGKTGLAAITAQLIRFGGAGSRSGSQINDDLNNMGATIESRMAETSAVVSFGGLKDSMSGLLEIYRDVLTKPLLDGDQLDTTRSQARAAIGNRNANAVQIAKRELTSALYGKESPFMRQEDYNSVGGVRRTDVQRFYDRYYFPKNTMLAVWGDFETAKMKDDLTNLFASWTADQQPVGPIPAVVPADPATLLAVKKDLKDQAVFSMGLLSDRLDDKDYAALAMAATILGRGEQSRYARKFRGKTDTGDTVTVADEWTAGYDMPGTFQITGTLPAFQTVSLLKTVEEEAGRLRNEEVTEAELNAARNQLSANLAMSFDTTGKAMTNLMAYEYAGYPKDFPAQLEKSIGAVTRADILRVAKAKIDPAKFTLVVVGNPTQFVDDLGSLGRKVTPLDLTIPEASTNTVEETPETLDAGKKILAAAQKAAGGAEALAAIQDYTENSDLQLEAAAGGNQVAEKVQWLAPNYFREEQDSPAGKTIAFTDNEVGWLAVGRNSAALGGNDLKKVKGDLFRFYVPVLLSDRLPNRKVMAVDDYALEISDSSGNVLRADFDRNTNLLHKLVYTEVGGSMGGTTIVETFSDFRDVNGVKFPFKVSAEAAGRKYAEGTIGAIKLNTGLKAEELRKRP